MQKHKSIRKIRKIEILNINLKAKHKPLIKTQTQN